MTAWQRLITSPIPCSTACAAGSSSTTAPCAIDDLDRFLEHRNHAVHRTHAAWLSSLGEHIDRRELLSQAAAQNDPDLERLCHEYLPLTFSRRHGDPSRPWNMFAINVQDTDGNQILDYQGNWRDIFQNWEALCYSFPVYLESIVAKFVNASTVDGFNPYRVTRDGIDWEVPDPENSWSNIGYWGDHQIIYLLRLLEGLNALRPRGPAEHAEPRGIQLRRRPLPDPPLRRHLAEQQEHHRVRPRPRSARSRTAPQSSAPTDGSSWTTTEPSCT